MDPKTRKNTLLVGISAVIIVIGALLAFRDSLFSKPPELDDATLRAVEDAQQAAEPPSAEPPASNFSKQAKQVERPGGG